MVLQLWSGIPGLNADLKHRIASASIEWLYVDSGLNIAHAFVGAADDTNAGLNLFAGVESLKGNVHSFGEFRITAGKAFTAQIAVGLIVERDAAAPVSEGSAQLLSGGSVDRTIST